MNKRAYHILVVGGAGYIGSHVTKALKVEGYQPYVFDDLSSGCEENLLPGVPFTRGSILNSSEIEQACEGMDAVIHLAALKAAGESMKIPETYAHHNLTGSINLFQAMVKQKVSNIVFSSSAAVYGNPEYLPMDEEHPTKPLNFYGYTKLAIEELLQWFDQLHGMRSACLRYFNAAGYDIDGEINGLERNPNNLLPIVLEAVMGTRSYVDVYGDDYDTADGSGVRDYIHVNDLASAHVKALSHIIEHDQSLCVNLGTSEGASVFEIINKTKALSGVDFEVRVAPRREGDPATVLAKSEKAWELLGWKAEHSDLDTLVQSMLTAYAAH